MALMRGEAVGMVQRGGAAGADVCYFVEIPKWI
jgi:hypothetical protein